MMHDHEKSDPAIVAVKSPNKTGEPAAEAMERRAGAEENASQQHAPDTEPGKRVTDAGPRTDGRKVLPSISEVGAGCGKPARPDLCGGRPATDVPTANAIEPSRLAVLRACCCPRAAMTESWSEPPARLDQRCSEDQTAIVVGSSHLVAGVNPCQPTGARNHSSRASRPGLLMPAIVEPIARSTRTITRTIH